MVCRPAQTAAASQELQETAEKMVFRGDNFGTIFRYLYIGATIPSSNGWIEKREL